jgi:hypothetical protein
VQHRLFTTANRLAQIGGPALGGILYAITPGAAFVTPCVLYGLAALLTSRIPGTVPVRSRASPTLASVFSGFAFIRSRRLLLGVLSLDLFAVLFGGAVALLPIYARDILLTGPWGLGLLRARRRLARCACRRCWCALLRHSVGPCCSR